MDLGLGKERGTDHCLKGTHLPAEGHDVLPESFGLTLVCLPPLLHMHTLPAPQGCDSPALGH